MAEFNSCAKLTEGMNEAQEAYDAMIADGQDILESLLNMQAHLQHELSIKNPLNKDPSEITTLGDIYDSIRDSKIALDDEFREIVDALPGMSLPDKDRSAVWKKWKADYKSIRERNINSLSKNDREELIFEATDMLHFVFNILIALKIDSRTLFTHYYLKNKENFNRRNNGY